MFTQKGGGEYVTSLHFSGNQKSASCKHMKETKENKQQTVTMGLTSTGCNQLKLVLTSYWCIRPRNSMACQVTSRLDFDKAGCQIQAKWTKVPCGVTSRHEGTRELAGKRAQVGLTV